MITFEYAYKYAQKHGCYLKPTSGAPFGVGFTVYEDILNKRWQTPFMRRGAFIKTLPKVIAHINEYNKTRRPVSDAAIEKFKQIEWIPKR
jgi:hypothetical protein